MSLKIWRTQPGSTSTEESGERVQQFVLDPDSASALQDDVELVLDSVTVAGRGLPRCQAP